MSLIKKSDVKKYLATKASSKLLPFSPRSQPDATGYSGNGVKEAVVNTPDSSAPTDGADHERSVDVLIDRKAQA